MQTVQSVKTNQFFLTRNSAVQSSIVLVPNLNANRSGKTIIDFFGRINNESSIFLFEVKKRSAIFKIWL